MDSFNILFTSSGRRFSFIKHFKETFNALDLNGKIVTADLRKNVPTAFAGDIHETVPRVTDEGYIKALIEICKKYNINLLIPLIDTELLLLSEKKELFESYGVKVLVCSSEGNRICRDKKKTEEFFKSIGVLTPAIFELDTILNSESTYYPYLIKPIDGSCSIGVAKVNSQEELIFFSSYVHNSIIQEFIEGEEYTVDVLVDFNGIVRCVVPRLRIETRAGEVSKGMTVKNVEVISATKKVAEQLPGALGCLTIQCFLSNKGEIFFIEINPRFGGGFPLSAEAGADFPRWIIEMMLGYEPEIKIDGWQENIVMLRYDDAVFTTKEML